MEKEIKHSFVITALRYLLAVTAIILLSFPVSAQEKPFRLDKITSENIKIEKGLSVNSVYCILQDKTGFMWFGTWDGLNKFDGYKFTVYKATEFEKGNKLSNSTIHSLCLDNDGYLWIGTENGLNKFDAYKQTFTNYKHIPGDKSSLSNDTVLTVFEDSYSNLWAGTQNGLNLVDKQSGKITQLYANPTDKNSLSNNSINDVVEDRLGCVWIATENGLNRYNLLSKEFTRYLRNPANPNSLCNDTINSVMQDKDGLIWIGTANGLCSFDIQKEIFTRYYHDAKNLKSISSNYINIVFEDSKGSIWIGTEDGGLNIFDKKTNVFTHYRYISNDINSLSSNNISDIYEDKSGIIWVASSKGVNKIDRNSYKFLHFQHAENDANSINNDIVWAFHEDKDGNIWIGTDEGLNYFNRKTGTFKVYKSDPADKNSISGNIIKAIMLDKDGDTWIGTASAGLDIFKPQGNGRFTKTNLDKKPGSKLSLCDNTVWCLLQDKEGYIWIGTNNGLNRYDKKKNEMKSFRHNPEDPFSISNNIINVIYEDKAGTVWFGTYDGLNSYDKKTGKFYACKHQPGNNKSLSSNRVFGIFEDDKGTMWIGTMGGGLNRFDRNTSTFKYYTEKDGLANNMVYCILQDNEHNLWLTTNNGISKFNIKSESFVNYDVKDGVQSSEFNQNAALKTKDGEFFLGGMNGFNAFYPQNIKQNTFIPPIVITGFKKLNELQDLQLKDGDTIELSYMDNFFSFEFSSLDYSNPAKNKFAFMLEKFDKDWITCDANKRFAEYTKVSPGIYRFRVKGTNSDGEWNNTGIAVTIIITPPWWATWTFRIPLLLLLIFTVWFLFNLRFKQLRKKHQMEKKVFEIERQVFDLEQKALRLQMNPHFIFNSLNSIQSFIINSDADKATLYLAKFAQLMRLILTNSVEPFVSVRDEIKGLVYYFDIEKLRFDDKFDYKIEVDPDIDDEFIGIPPMVMQPYVENAILHGVIHKADRGHISVSLKLQKDAILCCVEDDGIGREKAMEIRTNAGLKHVSRGMMITEERLQILNSKIKGRISVNVVDLKDDIGRALGTKVEILLPFVEL